MTTENKDLEEGLEKGLEMMMETVCREYGYLLDL